MIDLTKFSILPHFQETKKMNHYIGTILKTFHMVNIIQIIFLCCIIIGRLHSGLSLKFSFYDDMATSSSSEVFLL